MTEAVEKLKAGLRLAAVKGRNKAFAEIREQPDFLSAVAELTAAVRELRAATGKHGDGAEHAAGGLKLTITEYDLQGRVRSFQTEPVPGQNMKFTITERREDGEVKSFQSEAL